MYLFNPYASLLVSALLFRAVLAEIDAADVGQIIGGVEKLNDIANICLEKLPLAKSDSFGTSFQRCFKVKVFECVDDVLNAPIIQIGSGIEMVKVGNDTSDDGDLNESARKVASTTWTSLVTDRAEKVFQTHDVRVNFVKSQDIFKDEARRGHKQHYKLLFPLMVVIFMKMAAFLVPLGFQFMAMIGGKALLLSKMALLLASVQGLKSVANSGFGYGVYPQPHHSGGSPHTDHHYSSGYGRSSA